VSRAAARRDPRRGMTLIEVMLALALMVMLGLFIVGVIRSVLGIWQTSERRGRGDLQFQATAELLRSDLDAFHNGPRGWLVLDQWRARPATEEEPAWFLPRLRFLAKGSGLPGDDPSGERGVEIAWMLVPERAGGRLCRLVRYAQPEGAGESLLRDSVADGLARQGAGLAVLDGVAWLELELEEADGERRRSAVVAPEQPYDFPRRLHLSLDRVSGRARTKPPTLDEGLGSSATSAVLRGSAPLDFAPIALVEQEWLAVAGAFPRFTLRERGARGTAPAAHDPGAPVYLAQRAATRFALPAGGRRVRP